MTTLATLTRVEGSMLGALAEALSDDEVLFIDRDGRCFRYFHQLLDLNLQDKLSREFLFSRGTREVDRRKRLHGWRARDKKKRQLARALEVLQAKP